MMRARRSVLGGLARLIALLFCALSLASCNALTRLSQVGEEPPMTSVQNPAALHGDEPVVMPMPPPVAVERQPNSLWRPGSRAFLKDQRASQVGDILTVVIQIDDQAKISNTTQRSRSNAEDAAAGSFLGFESQLDNILPDAVDPTSLVDLASNSNSSGAGSVNRDRSTRPAWSTWPATATRAGPDRSIGTRVSTCASPRS